MTIDEILKELQQKCDLIPGTECFFNYKDGNTRVGPFYAHIESPGFVLSLEQDLNDLKKDCVKQMKKGEANA